MFEYWGQVRAEANVSLVNQLYTDTFICVPADPRAEITFLQEMLYKVRHARGFGLAAEKMTDYIGKLWDERRPHELDELALETWVACKQRLLTQLHTLMTL